MKKLKLLILVAVIFASGFYLVEWVQTLGPKRVEKIFYLDEAGQVTENVQWAIEYVRSNKQGTAKEFYRSGTLKSELNYSLDRLHGPAKGYFESGSLQDQYMYRRDKLKGPTTMYFETGAVAMTLSDMSGGIPNGNVEGFYPSGKTRLRCFYAKGKLENGCTGYAEGPIKSLDRVIESKYPDGTLEASMDYSGGVPHGPYKMYFLSGKLSEEGTFQYGKLHGVVKHYYESGKLRTEIGYEKGVMQGIFKEYDELGQVVTDGRMKFWHPEIAP